MQILMCCFGTFGSPRLDKIPQTNVTPLWQLVPALSLCALFYSSTLFSESITKEKYPRAYAAYQRRVGMFVPVLTVLKGWWLEFRNQKKEVDALVFGDPDAGARNKID